MKNCHFDFLFNFHIFKPFYSFRPKTKTNRKKQMTVTLVVVTVVSLVTWLPGVVLFILVYNQIISYHQMSFEFNFHVAVALTVMTTANSLVNPILYAVRMAEIRKIVCQLFRRSSGRREAHDIIYLNNRNI